MHKLVFASSLSFSDRNITMQHIEEEHRPQLSGWKVLFFSWTASVEVRIDLLLRLIQTQQRFQFMNTRLGHNEHRAHMLLLNNELKACCLLLALFSISVWSPLLSWQSPEERMSTSWLTTCSKSTSPDSSELKAKLRQWACSVKLFPRQSKNDASSKQPACFKH